MEHLHPAAQITTIIVIGVVICVIVLALNTTFFDKKN